MRRPDTLLIVAVIGLLASVVLIAWSTHVLMTDVLPYDWSTAAR